MNRFYSIFPWLILMDLMGDLVIDSDLHLAPVADRKRECGPGR